MTQLETTQKELGWKYVCILQVILAITITWIICAILTVSGVFPSDPDEWGYGASTDYRIDVINEAPWFRFPYPGW